MNTLAGKVLCISAAASILGACAGSPQIGAPAALPQTRAETHAKSWMSREASSDELLYYADGIESVYVLSYPAGKLVGTLTGFDEPVGVCSDANGNVFVTTVRTEAVYEYAHGGTQLLAKLGDYGYYPMGCAVDPVTGNLAVANTKDQNGNPGNVAIYAGATGKPTNYTAPGFFTYDWCTYDNAGNLYVNGGALAEMPYGSQTFNDVSLGVSGEGIRWDGQYVAMVNPTAKEVYRIAVSGSTGTVVGTVNFSGLFPLLGNDFAISAGKIVIPYGGSQKHRVTRIGQWRYPKGGRLQKIIHQINDFEDLTLSV